MTSAASKWSFPAYFAPPADVEGARPGAPQHRQAVVRIVAQTAFDQELVGSQQALAVLAELVLEHGRRFEALHFGGVRVDAVASIGIEQQRRARRQLREISILQPDKNQQQWPPPRRVELLLARLLRSRHLAHLVNCPGATLLIGGDRRKLEREPSAVGNIAAGQLLPRGVERGDLRVLPRLVGVVLPVATRALIAEDDLFLRFRPSAPLPPGTDLARTRSVSVRPTHGGMRAARHQCQH